MVYSLDGKMLCSNAPEKVNGLRGNNWPVLIASGISHSIAIGLRGGVLSCGSTALASSMTEQEDLLSRNKLQDDKFCLVSGLEHVRIRQVACGDYHTACINDEGQLFTWGGSLNFKMQRRQSRRDELLQNVVKPL